MALVDGDNVIPAGSFNGDGRVADLTQGTLCPEGLLLGVFTAGAGVDTWVIWNNGETHIADQNAQNLRLVRSYTGSDLLGKTVRLNNQSPVFQGVVVQQLNVELDNTAGDGTPVPVVVVRANGFQYVAEPSNLSEVN